jgi:hypothetical protein
MTEAERMFYRRWQADAMLAVRAIRALEAEHHELGNLVYRETGAMVAYQPAFPDTLAGHLEAIEEMLEHVMRVLGPAGGEAA